MENKPKQKSVHDLFTQIKKIFDVLKYVLLVPVVFVLIMNIIKYFLPAGESISPTLVTIESVFYFLSITALLITFAIQFMIEIIYAKDIGHIEIISSLAISLTILSFYLASRTLSLWTLILGVITLVTFVWFFVRELSLLKKVRNSFEGDIKIHE